MKAIKYISFILLFVFVFSGVDCFHHQAKNSTTKPLGFVLQKTNQNNLLVNVFNPSITAWNEETNDQELTSKSNVVSIIDLHVLDDFVLVCPQFKFLKKTKNKLFLMCDLPPPFNN